MNRTTITLFLLTALLLPAATGTRSPAANDDGPPLGVTDLQGAFGAGLPSGRLYSVRCPPTHRYNLGEPRLPGGASWAFAINRFGHVAGFFAAAPDGANRAWLWCGSTP